MSYNINIKAGSQEEVLDRRYEEDTIYRSHSYRVLRDQ